LPIINIADREIQIKIVYYGPGRCGKTTNMEYIYELVQRQSQTKLVSIETRGDRTLFFDYLPIDVGTIRGSKIRLQLYTVPGQPKYNTTRKLVLRGTDGVIFVADSLLLRRKANLISFANLKENLSAVNLNLSDIPLVLQYNKRDLAVEGVRLLSLEEMDNDFNPNNKYPAYPASANIGYNVSETLKKSVKLTMESVRRLLVK